MRRAFDEEDEVESVRMVMPRRANGDDHEHTVAESFLTTLEFKLVMKHDGRALEDVRRAILRNIAVWYNRECRHSTLGSVRSAVSTAPVIAAT